MSDRERGARAAARRGVPVVVLALCLAASPAAAQGPAGYANPVLGRAGGVADPFILKWNGEYYLYATGDPIMAYHSRDLVHWDTIGGVLHSSSAPSAWNQTDVWAPEVVYRNGRFYLYYTASKTSPDWRVSEYARRVGVAVAESPRGPFVDAGHPVTPYWTIDGDVLRDPDGPNAGSDWLFASYLDEAGWHGAGITADRLSAPDRAAGAPALVTRGTEAWEDKDGDPHNGSLRYTNEGPTVFKRHGRYYMMYSGGSWDLPTYALAYAWSDSLPRGGLNGPGWNKVVPPILRSTPIVDAPGHNTLTFAPNNVDYVTGYHARVVPFAGPGDRQTFLDRVYWNHDRPFMEQPTTGTHAVPDRPAFGDIFDRPDGPLGAAWVFQRGGWRIVGQEAWAGANAVAIPTTHGLGDLVLEGNVRMMAGAGPGAAGVSPYYHNEYDHVAVLLDRGRRALVTAGTLQGRAVAEQVTALPADFRFDAYHQLLVTRNGNAVTVALDGVMRQSRRFAMGTGDVAVLTRGAPAAFDGIAVTSHYEDTFDEPASLAPWNTRGGSWSVAGGALRQTAPGGRTVALRGEGSQAYEFTASVRLQHGDSASEVGIVAASDGSRSVLAGFDHTIWPFARFHVRLFGPGLETARPEQELQVEMPRGFLYDQYHTIRVLRQGSAFTFWLDGQEIVAAHFPMGVAGGGLFIEGGSAEFDDVAYTRVVTPRNLLLDGSFEAERWTIGPAAPELPWRLQGAAQVSQCCGHSGIRRLLLTAQGASATQVVTGLAPGRYTLDAWLSAREAEAELVVSVGGGTPIRATSTDEAWRRARVGFDVSTGQDVTISLGGRMQGQDSFVAADDVYLGRER